MYMMKIDPLQVSEMYMIREELKKYGIRKPITKQVREAIDVYVNGYKKNIQFEGGKMTELSEFKEEVRKRVINSLTDEIINVINYLGGEPDEEQTEYINEQCSTIDNILGLIEDQIDDVIDTIYKGTGHIHNFHDSDYSCEECEKEKNEEYQDYMGLQSDYYRSR